jgi:SagB-type dehydrogenase family enzyme
MTGIGPEFMEKTKFQNLTKSDQMRGVEPPPLELRIDPKLPIVDLPSQNALKMGSLSLKEAVEGRRSVRSYSRDPISLEELSFLLWCTQGVQQVMAPHATLRTVPSAGARHALETYLLVSNVDTLKSGLYRYKAFEHQLAEIDLKPGIGDSIVQASLGQHFVKTCGAAFIWTAVPYRMTWRYGERGYRYLLLDAGHACQNLYLCAESIGCGVCAIGAFSDDDMNRCLGIDSREQFVIYMATVGKR